MMTGFRSLFLRLWYRNGFEDCVFPDLFLSFQIIAIYLRYKIKIKMETIVRRQISFRLSEDLLERLKIEADKVNRSLNNFVESALMDLVYKRPNQITIDAIKEAQSGEELEVLDMDNFTDYVAKL